MLIAPRGCPALNSSGVLHSNKQGTTSDAEGVGIKLLQHLNPSWSTEGAPKSQFTLDILGAIEQQVNTQAFWRIDPGFFVMHPEFQDCGKLA